ncbi:MAG: amino acid transporter [Lasallia pustulata]|uniref:Amino acid transporter n=1 Tax=Lasallia pustulata TaxID=136370 RepID=A0A5M8PHE8_9LECA|nr:MAG: amino acid transporter [Lasallia pustulata]
MPPSSDLPTDESVRKTPLHVSEVRLPRQLALDGVHDDEVDDSYHGQFTRNDRRDMGRMGKVQELRRNFRSFSALSFTVVLQGTWEVLLVATSQGLVDGGVAGLFWSYIWTFFGFGLVVVSLAEMASMAPTAGGQYHWVSEFSPPQHQKWLSYFIGWMSALSWQAGQASGPFLVGTLIQGILVVNDPTYSPTNWQGTLFVFAIVVLIYFLNVWGANAMPMINNIFLIVHIFGFLAIVVTLWVLSPRNTGHVVFTQFVNGGGWSSMGLALMVGQISAIYACICSDSAAHISEEVRDAAFTVPRTMFWSYILNGALGVVMLTTYLFCITDLDTALNDPSGYPVLWVFHNTTSLAGANVLSFITLLMVFAGTVSFNISTSRQTWSFARDNGLPFSKFLAHVDPKRQLPVRAIVFSCVCTSLLALINIGSSVAFNAIISLNLVSLMLTYMTSIGCVLLRRIRHPELLPRARWSLGRWGVPVNIGGLAYSTHAFFWCFWPNATPVDVTTFNWALVMFWGLAVIALVYYWVKGRHVYKGPVVLVEGWREE